MTAAPVVSVAAATVRLGRQLVLNDVDLSIAPGEIVAVIGANGSGKSTLLRLIVGLVRPQAGTVTLFGSTPTDVRALRRVGAAIDTPALYPWMSGRAVLRTLLNLSGEADGGRSAKALERFGLANVGRKPVLRYSQGMRKRLALAAASLHEPDLLLLDEPTNALDPPGRSLVWSWIGEHRDHGGSVLVVTHHDVDAARCDRVLSLTDGHLEPASRRSPEQGLVGP